MLLNPGETIISTDPIAWSNVPGVYSSDPGYLHVTNHRLVFEPHRGAYSGRMLVNLDLGQITDLHAGTGPDGHSVVIIHSGQWVCVLATDNAANVVKAVADARIIRLTPAPTQAHESGKPLVYLHCKHCGSLNAAGSVHCTSCGATL